jgi:uncharacterized membrane protein YgcG
MATPSKSESESVKKTIEKEKNLLEAVPEAELMMVMLGKVKVMGTVESSGSTGGSGGNAKKSGGGGGSGKGKGKK